MNKEDARINWQEPAINIERAIRAFNPWPIAYTSFGTEILRIHQARIIELPYPQAPARVLTIDKTGVLIASGDHGILIERVQRPGGKVISTVEWLNSAKTRIYPGFCFDE